MTPSSSRRSFLSGPLSSDAVILVVILLVGACLFTGFLMWFNSVGAAGAAGATGGSGASGEASPPVLPFIGQAQPSAAASPTATPSSQRRGQAGSAAGTAYATVTSMNLVKLPRFTEILAATFTKMASLTPLPPIAPQGSTPHNPGPRGATHVPGHQNTPTFPTQIIFRPPVQPCAHIPQGGIGPSDDTWIDSSAPTRGHASDKNLFAQKSNGTLRRGLLKFDLSAVPSVSKAMLYLHVQQPSSVSVSVYQLQSDWNESTATWDNGLSGPWSTPGGDYQPAEIAHFVPRTSCNVAVNVTALAQSWASAPSANFGLILIVSGQSGPAAAFASRERSSAAPSLIITP